MSQKRIPLLRHASSGQALVEYALILVLVVFALAVALAATGPAISNVFSNTVYNLIGLSGTPVRTIENRGGGPVSFWATVTWVAANPPGEIPFPTNPPQPPTTTPTAGPSPTPTIVTPSPTPSNTPTQPPTATPTDYALVAPFSDTVDTPERWRLDSSVWIGSDEWRGEYFPNQTLTGTPDFSLWNGQIDPTYKFNVNFDWGTGTPVSAPAAWLSDSFSIRYTRYIYAPVNTRVRFALTGDDQARLRIQTPAAGGPITDIIPWTAGNQVVYTIPAGFHNLIVEYREGSGSAGVSLTISNAGGVNPDDTAVPSGAPQECSWGRVNTSRANTLQWMWDSDLVNDHFPTGRRCYLEFRGSVDLAPLTQPTITFWDLWDLSGGGGLTTSFQVAEYNADRAAMVWTTIPLHTGPTTNYNWTRQTIPVPAALVGKKIAFRFVMENNSNNTTARRWYVDDLEIDNFDTNANLQVCTVLKDTCGTYWSLNDTAQRSSFIASGRWDLTNTNTQTAPGGTQMSWDDSPGAAYTNNWEGGPRIHSLEFKGWINLTNLPASGVGGITDADGDDGRPLLSFWMAYDIDQNDRFELQWTRDPYNAGNGATWTTLTALVPTDAVNRQTDLTMSFKEILLDAVPNWQTQRFRLRWALVVTDNNNNNAQGVYVDDIYLERENKPAFSPYPFFDDSETANELWRLESQWARTNTSGVFGSAQSYTDSPLGNYPGGVDSAMQLKGPLDLNNDTPENLSFYGGNKGFDGSQGTPANKANRPMLVFWQWHAVAANEVISVEISNNDGTSWTTIWDWNYLTDTRTDRQLAWERVEIDLQRAVEQISAPLTWTQVTTNGVLTDDDILIRIRLDTRSATGSNSDGVYIDNISIANYSELAFKLWDVGFNANSGSCGGSPTPVCGLGNGTVYSDDIDNPSDWWNRWYTGGRWAGSNFTNSQHSGLLGLHDSPPSGTMYTHDTYSVLEMRRIIDLRGTTSSQRPTLYFWTKYRVGNNDLISVQISSENASSLTQDYERVARWDAWTRGEADDRFVTGTTDGTVGPYSSGISLDTWTRVQVDLSSYVGKRIRVRFVLDALDSSSNVQDGWWIDDVSFELRSPRIFNLPFFDSAQNTQNWVVEGIWGLDAEKFRGSGGGPASLGPDPYYGYYFDCELSAITCSSVASFTTLLAQPNGAADLAVLPVVDVNYDFGTTGRPPGAPTNATGATWDNFYGARWERDITVQAGQFTFITVSDDGVRLRYNAGSCPFASTNWNIINQWGTHSRRVDMRNLSLAAGNYCLTLEWFEYDGDAVIILTAGNNNFSFSDSPKLVAGGSSVTSIRNGNSSLMLDGLLNLNGVTTPVLEFWTQYDLSQNTFARVEVTTDGGFTWGYPSSLGTLGTCDASTFCNPTIGSSGGTVSNIGAGEWEQRRHNLASFIGNNVGLRFRLSTPSSSTLDGWWFTDIQVNQ